jgi:nucleoside-diphosphate-sugar epimerase
MKIFLTGGTSMVSKNILENSRSSEHVFIPSSTKDLNLIDRNAVRNRLKMEMPDMVIHTAAVVSGIHANIANPVKYMTDNAYMGLNIIMEAYSLGIPNLLNFGSSCMYPRNIEKSLTEDLILKGELEPTNEGYALAKIMSTRLCEYVMRESKDIFYKTVIPCNIYGRHDNFDPNFSHLVPAVIKKLDEAVDAKVKEVDIWGDGKSRREFISAKEVANFVFWTIDNMENLPQNINFGLGYDFSVYEYYQEIAKVVGYEGKFTFDLSKPSGMKQKLCDIKKLNELGWNNTSTLNEGLQETYEYYLKDIKNGI